MNKDLKSTFKNIFKRKNRHSKAKALFGSDAEHDWKTLFLGFLMLNTLILLLSGYLFWRINKGGIFEISPSSAPASDEATRASLQNTLDFYNAREKHFEDLRIAQPGSADPAL